MNVRELIGRLQEVENKEMAVVIFDGDCAITHWSVYGGFETPYDETGRELSEEVEDDQISEYAFRLSF